MTYGPPNSTPSEPNQARVPTAHDSSAQPPALQRLLAPTAAPNLKSLLIGAVIALVGLLLIVFGFLNWLSYSATKSLGPVDASVALDLSVSGVGNPTADTEVRLPDAIPAVVRDGMEERVAADASDVENREDGPGSPATWTIVCGVLLIAGGALMALRRFPGIGAVIAALAGLAATCSSIAFVADPLGAFGGNMTGENSGADLQYSAGYGLWLTLIASLVALAAAALAVAVTLAPGRSDGVPVRQAFGQSGSGQEGSVQSGSGQSDADWSVIDSEQPPQS
ncbi:hypothetical protein [Gordonia zhaorongruii]|uniref:hypothetical protein n=1 Tax=Gordonia zhaorongruii TaxID=2597659 RepID=UPI00117DB027|nr:hypothetical protein [Gordonia zhaorongruii]